MSATACIELAIWGHCTGGSAQRQGLVPSTDTCERAEHSWSGATVIAAMLDYTPS